MRFQKVLLASLAVIALTATSCSNDDDTTPQFNYSVPETYTFANASGASTVDFSGQKSRVLMLDEMGAYVKTQGTTGAVVDNVVLSDMYANINNRFTGAGLNTSGKQLKDKTAASKDYFSLSYGGGTSIEQSNVRAFFETTFTDVNAASQGATAATGVAGKYSGRYYSANGLEPVQVFLKGMMGACFMDQVVNNYLSVYKLDEGTNRADNTNKVPDGTKSYTKMEHAWDEAYGYIYGADDLTTTPATPVFKFWSSYINQVNADADFNTIKADINLAFRKGRAAITANDYVTRDAQISIIKAKLALIPAVRAVYYLQAGKGKFTTANGAGAFHDLSEGYGFIMSLRYTNKPGTNNPYFTKAEVDAMLTSMTNGTNGLWDINNLGAKLDVISADIAAKFGFSVPQAATVN
jgi:hypothetical protein